MLYISDNCTEPYHNLATEEYLLKEFKEPILRLWRNSSSIIIGRNQNALAEIDYQYVNEHNIKVVRRLTGGGAVFHDLGNLNYTFIQEKIEGEDTAAMFKRFTAPIIDALRAIGVNAYLQGRNDLLIDGRKFSGNAVCIHNNRVLQHGTLMFDVSTSTLAAALKARPEKFIGKAVQSNRSRVTNIKEHLKPKEIMKNAAAVALLNGRSAEKADIEWFKEYLGQYIIGNSIGEQIVPHTLTERQQADIEHLTQEKYSTPQWNIGQSPKYTFSAIRRFTGGFLELYLTVKEGIITDLEIKGDYFFTRPTEEFAKAMIGTPHTKEEVAKKIGALDTDAYFANISKDEIEGLFFICQTSSL